MGQQRWMRGGVCSAFPWPGSGSPLPTLEFVETKRMNPHERNPTSAAKRRKQLRRTPRLAIQLPNRIPSILHSHAPGPSKRTRNQRRQLPSIQQTLHRTPRQDRPFLQDRRRRTGELQPRDHRAQRGEVRFDRGSGPPLEVGETFEGEEGGEVLEEGSAGEGGAEDGEVEGCFAVGPVEES